MFDGGKFKLVAKPLIFEVSDVLNTPKGANFGNPDYGSNRFELVDQPLNGRFRMKAFKETAEVVMKYFPELTLVKMELLPGGDGETANSTAYVRCYFKNGERIDV